jgi:hypothetical protein
MRHRHGHRSPTRDRQLFDTLADRYDRLHDLQADPIGMLWRAPEPPGSAFRRHTAVVAALMLQVSAAGVVGSGPMNPEV